MPARMPAAQRVAHALTRLRASALARRTVARTLALLLVASSSGVFIAASPDTANAGITAAFNQVFSADTTGSIQIRGNTILTCQDTATSCAAARAQLNQNDNSFFDTYIDVDSDPTTFDSSSSTVNIPSGGSVLFAALVWGGNTTAGGSLSSAAFGTGTAANSPTPASAGQVKLMVPGASTYATITSTRTSFLSGSTGNYQGYANITSTVQAAGNGSYTVANVQTATGTNIQGGWALAIAYSNPTDPPRDLTIFSGFGTVGAGNVVDIPVSGFKTPPSGAVTTTLGSISYEGDAASTGDQLLLGNTTASLQNVTDALHPTGNSFTSVISDLGVDGSARTPKYLNQLGFDAATFNVNGFLANGSTTADIRMTSAASGGETYYPGVITFATDLYSPNISATKTVALVAKGAGNTQAGVVEPGDTLQYTINATNGGQDTSVGTVLTDSIPAGTTYVTGSLTSGGTALTDATGDDVGSFNGTTKQLTVDVGTSATATVGGNVAVGASIATITFEVTVNAGIADGTSIPNTAALTYKGNQTGTAVTGASNAVTTPAVRHHSALTITKTANMTRVQKGEATPVTYTLTATNAGPYNDPAVTVTDTLPSGAVVVSATPSAGSCTTPAGQVVCTIGALANGATATVAVVVTLDGTTDPATDTATIAGTNVDSFQSDNTASVSTVVNTKPVANPDSATTSAGPAGTAAIAVLANDTDANGDPLTASAGSTAPTKGSIVVNADNTITYTANAGAVGTDTFSYIANDGRGGTATGTVTVTIPNQPPVANADSGSTTPGQPVTVNVLSNDTDPNIPASGQVLSVSAVTQPATGTVTTNGTTVTFTPSGTFKIGSASFTYTVSDGDGGTAVGNVTVTIPNVPPTAVNDAAATPYLAPVAVDVLVNDTDANGDPLTVTAVTGEAHGTAAITGSGVNTKVLYTPAAGWSGPDTMTYTLSDGTTTSTAQLTVTTADAPPTANSFSTTVAGGTPTTIDVVAHASDPNGDTLTVTAAGPAAHGTVSIGAGGVVYTPGAAYAGTDTFTYTVDDGHGGTATATVTVTVGNQAPVANADSAIATGLAGSPVTVDVLANDTDANSDPLTLTSVSVPAHGTAALVAGKVVYTPSASYTGPDTFTYVISDGNGGTAMGTVSVDVQNRNPIANPDTFAALSGVAANVDVVANDTDPDGETVSLLSVDPTSANGGTETIVGGVVHYVSAAAFVGTDTFSYVVTDPRGGTATGTVTVAVGSSAMVANSRTATTSTNTPVTVGLLSGVTDPGGHPISVDSAGPAAHGTVTLDASGNATYTPAAGYAGTDTFAYVVSDAFGGSAASTVTVTIANANPVAVDDTASVLTGNSITVNVLANDTDPNIPATSQTLTVSSATLVSGTAAVTVTPGGVQVVPGIGFTGDVVVQYVASDGAGGSATGQLTVHVTSPFVPPAPPVVPPVVVPPLKPVVIVGPKAPSKSPSRVEAATVIVTIVPAETSVTIDPASAVAGLGAVTIMSVTPPVAGVQVQVVDGLLVVTRTNKYVGTTTFNYRALAKNGTQVHVTVTAHVLGETITAPSLPFTGANVDLSLFVGLLLVLSGLFAIRISRRKPARDKRPAHGGSADFR